jgi:hypothetical protein
MDAGRAPTEYNELTMLANSSKIDTAVSENLRGHPNPAM